MGFKMRGFSPFTKETRYEGPRDGSGGGAKTHKTLKKGTIKKTGNITRSAGKITKVKTPKNMIEAIKKRLYNLDNPNSKEGKKLQAMLDKAGVDWRGPNADEVDQLWHTNKKVGNHTANLHINH